MPYAYLLRCSDDSLYAGSTWDLERRLSEHQLGMGAAYTRCRRPVELVWHHWFVRVEDAFAVEKRIQGWSRRKRIALIEGRVDLLGVLSARGHASRLAQQEADRADPKRRRGS